MEDSGRGVLGLVLECGEGASVASSKDRRLVLVHHRFAELATAGIRSAFGVVCKLVRIGARVFRPGDSIWNRERLMGLSLRPRLGVFRGRE